MQGGQSSTQNNQELEPKPLFVGQLDEKYRKKFRKLMKKLSVGYETDTVKNNGDISCICNYNYFEPDGDDIYDNKLIKPEDWVGLTIRRACIDIVNDALSLAGYGEYLTDNQTVLKETHKICCSVNYYDDRTGNQGFHQDSFGRELFVLLIYLDPVHGPEVRLKTTKEFKARMNYIDKMDFMPKCFTTKVRELHEYAIKQQGVTIEWDGGSAELNEDFVEWITPVNGPGGIVGFLDEMIIHATPYEEHREPNGDFLLAILKEMQNIENNIVSEKDLAAIKFLETIIKGIKEVSQTSNLPISIYEVQGIIEDKLKSIIYEQHDSMPSSVNDIYIQEFTNHMLQLKLIDYIKELKEQSLFGEGNHVAINFLEIIIQEVIINNNKTDHVYISSLDSIMQYAQHAMQQTLYELYNTKSEEEKELLLQILVEMRNKEDKPLSDKDLAAIQLLETIIEESSQISDLPISVDVLQELIGNKLENIIYKHHDSMPSSLNDIYIQEFENHMLRSSLITYIEKLKEQRSFGKQNHVAIHFLEIIIQEMINNDSKYHIYENGLYSIIQYAKYAIEETLYELYNNRLDEFEGNRELLLQVLGEMKVTKNNILSSMELEAIKSLETIIQRIIEETNHYITINELIDEIPNLNYLESELTIRNIIKKLYDIFAKMEMQKNSFNDGSVAGKLGASRHDMYKSKDSQDTIITRLHTRSSNRRMSVKLNPEIPKLPQATDGVKSSEKRSFLRVWVTAIPN